MIVMTVVQDLGYFMYFMTDPEFRQAHERHLLALYHSKLSEYLDLDGEDKDMTLEALVKEYEDHRIVYTDIALLVRSWQE